MDTSIQMTEASVRTEKHFHVVFVTALVVLTFIVCGTMTVVWICFLIERLPTSSADWANVVNSILLVLSLISLFILWKSKRHHDNGLHDQQTQKDNRAYQSFMNINLCGLNVFPVFFASLTLLSLVMPVFKAVAIASCFHREADFTEVSGFIVNVFICVFLCCQTMFLIIAQRQSCTTRFQAVLIMIIVSTNICLCVKCLADVMQDTLLNIQHKNWTSAYMSVLCDNQTYIIADGLRVIDKHLSIPIVILCLCTFEIVCTIWCFCDSPNGSLETADDLNEEYTVNETVPLLGLKQPPGMIAHPKTIWAQAITYLKQLYEHSYGIAIMISVGVLISHVYLDVKMGDPPFSRNGTALQTDSAFTWVQFVYINFICGAAFIGYVLVHRNRLVPNKLQLKHKMLIIGAVFHVALITLETVDAIINIKHHPEFGDIIVFFIKTMFHFIGLFSEVIFMIKTSDINILKGNTNKLIYIKGTLYFLAVCYLERCIDDTFLTLAVVRHASNIPDDFFGTGNWDIITRVLSPGVAYYRLKSALLCFENLEKCRR